MPAPELFERRQAAVLWERTGTDAHGAPIWTPYDPVQIRVRWVDNRSEAQEADGNVVSVDATAKVDREISIGSLLWLGALADLTGTSGAPPEDAMYVKTQGFTKDMKVRFTHRTVGLLRRWETPAN